jgi:hypothetical protein
MKNVGKILRLSIILLLVAGVLYLLATNYSFVFSKTVKGEVTGIERLTQPTLVTGSSTAEQLFSFAVAIHTAKNETFTASSEDRQFAVVKQGYCVEAKFYPYPPWDLDKGGTYFNARLIKIIDCPATAGK